jgi:hypothetical protein
MKTPLPSLLGGRRSAPHRWLIAALCLVAAACASSDPPLTDRAQPAATDSTVADPGSAIPGEPEPGGSVFGSPGEEMPASSPPENDGPGATETNFITPPCGADGSRQIPDAGIAGGGAEDAGVPDAVADGGAARKPCPDQP